MTKDQPREMGKSADLLRLVPENLPQLDSGLAGNPVTYGAARKGHQPAKQAFELLISVKPVQSGLVYHRVSRP